MDGGTGWQDIFAPVVRFSMTPVEVSTESSSPSWMPFTASPTSRSVSPMLKPLR